MSLFNLSRYAVVAAVAVAFSCRGAGAQKRGAMLSTQEARKIVQEQARSAGYPSSAPQTPAFPDQWPPAPGSRASFFVYAKRGMSTSAVRHEIYSPHLRVDIDLSKPSEPVATSLKERLLGTQAQAVGSPLREAELNDAQQILFEALTNGAVPTGDAAGRMKKAYKAWMTANPSLARELSKLMLDFTRWIEEQP